MAANGGLEARPGCRASLVRLFDPLQLAEIIMQALLVVDAQNEFSPSGQRAVPNHAEAIAVIASQVAQARSEGRPIAWIRHHNRPEESPAFVPGSWGAELSPGFGPEPGSARETLFEKDVFGAFTGTGLHEWLAGLGVDSVRVVGFYAHMCVSTSAREALVRGYQVEIDPAATGASDLEHPVLGRQSASDVIRSAFLHLGHMGVKIGSFDPAIEAAAEPTPA
jgi:nicotinamidase-related amidase